MDIRSFRKTGKAVTTSLGLLAFMSIQQTQAALPASMMDKTFPDMMRKIATEIDQSIDHFDSQTRLCKDGSIIRGRLLTAGKNCVAQDPARMALSICDGFTDFEKTTCFKNIKKSLTDQGIKDTLAVSIQGVKRDGSNIQKLVCDGDEKFRSKLPGTLKDMVQYCPSAVGKQVALPETGPEFVIPSLEGNVPMVTDDSNQQRLLDAAKNLQHELNRMKTIIDETDPVRDNIAHYMKEQGLEGKWGYQGQLGALGVGPDNIMVEVEYKNDKGDTYHIDEYYFNKDTGEVFQEQPE